MIPIEVVLAYLAAGFSVIPINSPGMPLPPGASEDKAGKIPLIDWKEFQLRKPTEDEVRAWWARWPTANPGVVTGALSNIIVVDVDGEEGLATLRTVSPVPPTPRYRTGRGEQLWFRHPGGTVRNFAKRLPGLDLRGDGGYVVVPPSLHRNGRRYEWVIPLEDSELAPPPLWLLDLVKRPRGNDRDGPGDTIHRLKLLQGVPEGKRHDTAVRIAGHYFGIGWRSEEIEALLIGFAARCTPPHDPDDIRRIISDLAQAETAKAEAGRAASPSVGKEWPTLEANALYGLAGDFVRLVEAHTEADPAGLLVQFLDMYGNVIGRGPHMVAEADRHYTNISVVLIGVTSKGRKGSAMGQTRARFRGVDETWVTNCIMSGLSSGEGLIWAVRDPIEKREPVKSKGEIVKYQTVIADEGVDDKRILIYAPEFASTLRVLGREGNTLSGIIREAWDTGTLRSLTKNSPAKATGAHVSVIGHITEEELLRYLDRTEAGNGFGNRILWVCVKRARVLPEGGRLQTVDFAPFLRRLSSAVDFARKLGDVPVTRDDEAQARWYEVYGGLSEGHLGLFGAITSRAEAQVLRLSLIYALLDESRHVRLPHLDAALGIWGYCEASARYVFGDSLGDPLADEILSALRARPEGMTRNEIRDLFGGHQPADKISRSLSLLAKHGLAHGGRQDTGGRPAERWRALTCAKSQKSAERGADG